MKTKDPASTPQTQAPASMRTALGPTQVIARLAHTDGWKLFGDGADVAIEKTFHFDGYLQTMAFANAVAYLAESCQHHPQLLIQYRSCSVRWNSHDVQGISANDFACAAKVDTLFKPDQD